METRFTNRTDAGRILARMLASYAGRPDVVVLGLPRGGVPVAYEVAAALKAPLDVLVVRKIGVPDQPELAMGAIAGGGAYTINRSVVEECRVTSDAFGEAVQREAEELRRRERAYRGNRAPLDLTGKIAILVDDGLATGSTMRAAILAVRRHNPAQVVVAVPVAPAETQEELTQDADRVVCALTPHRFYAVGLYYITFGQVGDSEVRELLARAKRGSAA